MGPGSVSNALSCIGYRVESPSRLQALCGRMQGHVRMPYRHPCEWDSVDIPVWMTTNGFDSTGVSRGQYKVLERGHLINDLTSLQAPDLSYIQ